MKWSHLLLTLGISLASCASQGDKVPDPLLNSSVLEDQLSEIMESDSHRLGITFSGRPTLVFSSGVTSALDVSADSKQYELEKYNSKAILFYLDRIDVSPFTVREIVDHALGHYYIDNRSKIIFGKNRDMNQDKKERLIDEGIAEYFRRQINNVQSGPGRLDQTDVRNRKADYVAGYYLVKPILDRFGVKKGVDYLLQHPLTYKDLTNLSGYQKRIITEMGRGKT